MDGDDADTWLAYYCFVNRNWAPSKYEKLSFREKTLIAEFVRREVKSREKQQQQMKGHRKGRRR